MWWAHGFVYINNEMIMICILPVRAKEQLWDWFHWQISPPGIWRETKNFETPSDAKFCTSILDWRRLTFLLTCSLSLVNVGKNTRLVPSPRTPFDQVMDVWASLQLSRELARRLKVSDVTSVAPPYVKLLVARSVAVKVKALLIQNGMELHLMQEESRKCPHPL